MTSSEKFCLRWNDFESNISSTFRELREDKDFFDVTLACDDEQLQAHKVILSACSPFFRAILRRNKHDHPLLYLKGVKYVDLVAVLNFMYHGEVNIAQEELNSFLAVAEDLQVKGLTQNKTDSNAAALRNPNPKPIIRDVPVRPDNTPKQHFQKDTTTDDDVLEVVPIKSEPNTIPTEVRSHPRTPVNHGEHLATAVSDPNVGFAEEEYVDYADYDALAGDYDGSMLDTSGLPSVGHNLNKDVETLVRSFMKKTTDEFNTTVWQCVQCGKVSKFSTNLKDHIEANHIEGLQFECAQCRKIFKSRPSLRTHMRLHKSLDVKPM